MGVASQSYLRAGVSVLLGIFVLGEHITLAIGIGLAAIIIGVAAINIPQRAFNARSRPSESGARHSNSL
jgi:drug/metabolite transporter (DMT)-like permease